MNFSVDGHKTNKLMRLKEVIARTGLSRSTIYNLMDMKSRQYDPTFPKQVALTQRAVAWVEHEVEGWISQRMGERNRALLDA